MRVFIGLLLAAGLGLAADSGDLAKSLGVSFPEGKNPIVELQRDGKTYVIDAAAHTIREAGSGTGGAETAAPQLFAANCATCHGPAGKGKAAIGSRDLTNAGFQKSITDERIGSVIGEGAAAGKMPAFAGKLTAAQIASLTAYVRSLGSEPAAGASAEAEHKTIYQPGDDVLFSLPTGRPIDEHAVIVNFAHRFAYDTTFTGPGRGGELFGLDNFALSSLGVRYGVTDHFSVDIFRSPSFIGRPIQLMAAYSLLEEHHGAPLNVTVRGSVEGQNNFRKNFTENLELVVSRSLGSRAQIYVVPTASFNDRRLVQGGLGSNQIPDLPGINAFSIGFGAAWDVRPTVALVAEVIPTVVGGSDLGIHRPAYSFGVQKKIYRHAFTLGFSTSPGTTVSQRAGTRATFLGDPSADKPGGLSVGFDLTRQIH
jgi:mono/diheme cytochrome c family protein